MKIYHKLAKICLGFVLLIIIAGSVVRMTGSGMGCPDWPKCFGYLIPPTSEDVIKFQPNHNYNEGEVIQYNAIFYYAKSDFKSGNSISITNWQKNTKHSYNSFNVTHTWIEFINRIITAVAGIPMLLLFVFSIAIFKKKKMLFGISSLVLFLMGFAAWLGKTVVDSNLMSTKISIHLLVAFLIVMTLTLALFKSKSWETLPKKPDRRFKTIVILVFILTVIQITLGVQVRQFVDSQIEALGYVQNMWLQNPEYSFYIHRSFSIVLLLVNFWLFYENKKQYHLRAINYLIVALVIEVVIGVMMSYLDFPLFSQPFHLVMSAILLALQLFIILRVFNTKTHNFAA